VQSVLNFIPKSVSKLPSYRLLTALISPTYAASSLPNLLKSRVTNRNAGFCKPLPYHLATAPLPPGADTRSQTAPARKERSSPEPSNFHNYTIISVGDFETNLCSPIENESTASQQRRPRAKISSRGAMGPQIRCELSHKGPAQPAAGLFRGQ
jgi:hypothetical protein